MYLGYNSQMISEKGKIASWLERNYYRPKGIDRRGVGRVAGSIQNPRGKKSQGPYQEFVGLGNELLTLTALKKFVSDGSFSLTSEVVDKEQGVDLVHTRSDGTETLRIDVKSELLEPSPDAFDRGKNRLVLSSNPQAIGLRELEISLAQNQTANLSSIVENQLQFRTGQAWVANVSEQLAVHTVEDHPTPAEETINDLNTNMALYLANSSRY